NWGAALVKLMNQRGAIVDTSHCSRRTTLDACEVSDDPVVASHTGASALCLHDRNKSDEEIRTLAESGGVIGICCLPFFLADDGSKADLNTWLDHAVYIAELVGPEHVAIGTDWPLPTPAGLRPPDARAQRQAPRRQLEVGFRPEHRV